MLPTLGLSVVKLLKPLWYLVVCLYVLLKEFLKLEVVTSGYIYPKIEDIFSFCSAFQIVGNTVLKAIVAHPQKRFVLFFCRGKQRHINCCSDTAITVGLDTSTYQNQIHVRLYVEAVVVQRFPWEVTCGQPVPKKHFTRYLAISGHDQTFFRSKINPWFLHYF